MANILNAFRCAACLLANAFGVGFIDWLGRFGYSLMMYYRLSYTVGRSRTTMVDFTAMWGEAVALFWACHGQSAWLKVASAAAVASAEGEV